MSPRQAQVPYSPTFTCSDSDITLVSCDGFHLPANTVKLRESSSVFADMFEVGTPEQAGVKLVETGVDIEWILRYSHLARTTKVVLNFPACLSTIKALHKYEIWRGLEAITAAFQQYDLDHALDRTPYVLSTSFHAYTFAALVEDHSLAERAIQQMSGLNFDWKDLVSLSKGSTCDNSAGRDLVISWADNRISALEAFATATAQLISYLKAPHSSTPYYSHSGQQDQWQFSNLELWNALISVNTVKCLDEKLGKEEPDKSRCKHCEAGHIAAISSFRAALMKLPKLGSISLTT